MQSIPLYKLVDMLGVFYQSELQAVNKTEDTVWEIEKVIKTRRRNNETECLVMWIGYSNKFNSWIKKSEIKNI